MTTTASVDNLSALQQSHPQLSSGQAQTTAVPSVPVDRYHKTALHVHSGFVDVGDDTLFFAKENRPYLEHLAKEMLLKQEKELSNQQELAASSAQDTATSEAMNMMEDM